MKKSPEFIKRGGLSLRNMARHVKPLPGATDGWFYENAKSIDVYIERAGQRTIAVRISRADLADWIKRTGTKP